ncbi:hypothetical protein [Massilia sp. CCM 8734]|uniref:hypothetical protein n=1 Tax=Massilia sp. CCM 8734 TaxID=2609283 RepID=UPI00141FE09D|nr:hypothetical protein [Massilia sp. CCM 8734]NIA00411.1 hypothetical protein [Massilia sp. CCM 8734]
MAVQIPPTITPVPTPAIQRGDRATFSSRVDAFINWLVAARTEFSAVAANVYQNALEAMGFANSAAQDRTQTGLDRVQTGLDRVQTGQDRAAAAASAATIGTTAAFSDANSMVKNAADNTKQGKFKADLISTGVTREWQMPDKNGRVALMTDTALVLLASVTPADNALTIDLLNVFTSAYDNYKVIVRTMEGSSATGDYVNIRFAVAGVIDANTRYNYFQQNGPGTTNTNAAATAGRAVANLFNTSICAEVEIFNANGTNTAKGWISRGAALSTSTGVGAIFDNTYGFYTGASAISGFRLFVSGSSSKFLAKGSIEVYGYNKVM